MKSKGKITQPLFYQEVIINDEFTCHTFIKKGLRIFSSLVLKTQDADFSKKVNPRYQKNSALVKLFQRIKLLKRADLKQFQIENPLLPAFLYIVKRMSHVRALSINDHRGKETNFQGLFTTCPKYMKKLRLLDSQIRIHSSSGLFAWSKEPMPKKMSFPSDFLRFLPKFEEAKVDFPLFNYCSQMDKVCQFKKYPDSLRKLSVHHPGYNPLILNVSIQHLKGLRDLEIILFPAAILELMNSAYNLISQAPVKLQALSVNFGEGFEIDVSIHKAIRRLVNLKKAKIRLSSAKFTDNLHILQSLEDCPLESLNLEICLVDDQEVLHIRDLISKKKKTLKNLKLFVRNCRGKFESPSLLEKLAKIIDDLPQLTSLSFCLLAISVHKDQEEQLTSLESSLNFTKLLSKPIPLRKLKLMSDHSGFSKDRFLRLLKSIDGVALHLKKLQINVGQYEPGSDIDAEVLINFLKRLEKIQVLKLDNLYVPQEDFPKIMKAIGALRNLTEITIGRFSEEIPKEEFVQSFGKILRKYGLRRFDTKISDSFMKDLDDEGYSSCLDVVEIKMKNPYFQYCPLPMKLSGSFK